MTDVCLGVVTDINHYGYLSGCSYGYQSFADIYQSKRWDLCQLIISNETLTRKLHILFHITNSSKKVLFTVMFSISVNIAVVLLVFFLYWF